ncbi:cutinase family protein [Corynebacterium liangguodongii]|uniref:Carbohydrate esterase n=1 Tax=Corynebacterium liangguodongii TaxID=2079535 RepID=A0A2S0WGE9_9CORY|nr:cutinase family protein [Corynebacterium liangguodongii]AWB84843.1 carbohydrate esterase [Corynebacterium liangguodongii]PWB99200.1 cutinase family protein [Corynebacterium liangguodongii]
MRKLLIVVSAIVVIALIAVGIAQWRAGRGPGVEPPTAQPPAPAPEVPAEPEWCPAVQFVAIPGTWESSPGDDPFNPQANQLSFMLSITRPLQQAYDINRVRVWTTPYTAQFRNIQTEQGRREMSYDDSRNEGTARTNGELEFVAATCPTTKFIIAGFSQGAVIAGDIANQIGTRQHAVAPERLLGVVMIADGRRENGVGINPGAPVGGIGAEIAMKPLQGLAKAVTPGATMRGPRPGGFGEVSDRAFEICAPNDSICDAPQDLGTLAARAGDLMLANGIHAQYATNPDVIPGTTAPAWTVDWARGVIDAQ